MIFNKKASLEISIQAIVIIVLAMTLLGLGLGFIKSMFKNIGGIQEDISQAVKDQILNDLITNDKKISFSKSEIVMDKGESQVLAVGVRNKKDTPLNYKMRFNPVSGPDGAPFSIDNPPWFQFAQNQVYKLPAAEPDIRSIRLNVPSVNSGSYFLTFEIVDDDASPPDNVYAQKDFFIVIRG